MTELLAGLDRDQLQALLLKLAEHEPGITAAIQAKVPLLASSQSAGAGLSSAQLQPVHPPMDPSELRLQVQALLGSGGRRYREPSPMSATPPRPSQRWSIGPGAALTPETGEARS